MLLKTRWKANKLEYFHIKLKLILDFFIGVVIPKTIFCHRSDDLSYLVGENNGFVIIYDRGKLFGVVTSAVSS